MRRLLRVLPRHAALVTAAALAVAGLATTAALTLQARDDLDQTLLVAAHAHADPGLQTPWAPLGGRAPVELQTVAPDALPEAMLPLAAQVVASERPRFVDHQLERWLLLPIEPPNLPTGQPEDQHVHRIVVARAPAVGIGQAAGSFLLAYGPLALAISLAAAWAHRRTVARELLPLARLADRLRQLRPDELAPLDVQAESEELSILTQAIDGLLQRLHDSMVGHRRFAEVAAHELRSPLAALLAELEALDSQPGTQRAQALARRMATTTNALLTLSRLREDEILHQRSPTRPSELVLEALDRCRSELDQASCRVRITVDEDPELSLHPTLCITAVENLLRNAAVHAPGSEVLVQTRLEAPFATIAVIDDGAEGQASTHTSTGLGLRIVREVAEHHGGDFSLTPRTHGFTQAVLRLPLG